MEINKMNSMTRINHISFGLNNRNILNSRKLIEYWRTKGFSEDSIQMSMTKLERYASSDITDFPVVRFITSILNPMSKNTNKKTLPAIDFAPIKVDKITEIGFSDDIQASSIKKTNRNIPNILYSFATSHLKLPMNKVFKTPLEEFVSTANGEILEPKAPAKVVKEIIKNFNIYKKSEQTPNEYLFHEVRSLPVVTEI